MSDYIKREDAIEVLAEHLKWEDDEEGFGTLDLDGCRYIAKKQLKSVPSADVVENVRLSPITTVTKGKPVEYTEVVRCKYCIHNGSIDTDCPFGWKDKKFNMPNPNDFCSYGERKDNE